MRFFTGEFANKPCDYATDGKSTFALPNFQGSAPLQRGQGPGLSLRDLGESAGEQNVTLKTLEQICDGLKCSVSEMFREE